MANNETVKQVCERLRQFRDCDGDYIREIEDLADEAEAAHNRELAAKDAEIAKLLALVGELANALEYWLCDYDCETNGKCPADMKREECESFKRRALVTKAKKVVKKEGEVE